MKTFGIYKFEKKKKYTPFGQKVLSERRFVANSNDARRLADAAITSEEEIRGKT